VEIFALGVGTVGFWDLSDSSSLAAWQTPKSAMPSPRHKGGTCKIAVRSSILHNRKGSQEAKDHISRL
jgi:hypothetical protein